MTDRDVDTLLDTGQLPAPAAGQISRIQATVLSDLKPVRPLAPAILYSALFAALFVAACILGWVMVGRRGWSALDAIQRALVFIPLFAIAALLIYSLVHQMTPAGRYPRSTAFLAVAAFLWLLVFMLLIFRPSAEAGFVDHGLACFRIGMGFAVPAAFLLALLLRRGAGLAPRLTGATAGGLAGLAGLTVLEIHCPNLNLYHIVVWHVSVTVVCVLLGFIFSSVTFSRWRSNP